MDQVGAPAVAARTTSGALHPSIEVKTDRGPQKRRHSRHPKHKDNVRADRPSRKGRRTHRQRSRPPQPAKSELQRPAHPSACELRAATAGPPTDTTQTRPRSTAPRRPVDLQKESRDGRPRWTRWVRRPLRRGRRLGPYTRRSKSKPTGAPRRGATAAARSTKTTIAPIVRAATAGAPTDNEAAHLSLRNPSCNGRRTPQPANSELQRQAHPPIRLKQDRDRPRPGDPWISKKESRDGRPRWTRWVRRPLRRGRRLGHYTRRSKSKPTGAPRRGATAAARSTKTTIAPIVRAATAGAPTDNEAAHLSLRNPSCNGRRTPQPANSELQRQAHPPIRLKQDRDRPRPGDPWISKKKAAMGDRDGPGGSAAVAARTTSGAYTRRSKSKPTGAPEEAPQPPPEAQRQRSRRSSELQRPAHLPTTKPPTSACEIRAASAAPPPTTKPPTSALSPGPSYKKTTRMETAKIRSSLSLPVRFEFSDCR